jgi:pyruvate kinase
MLESMMNNPRPTRAEATDVANAIYQGTSAIMLSGETAAGKYPVESLKTMVRIAIRTEADIDYVELFATREKEEKPDMTTAISHATVMTAMELGAKTIITVSKTGRTARMISKYRPQCKIVGCSPDAKACRKLNMSWGVYPVIIKEEFSMEVLFLRAIERAKDEGYVEAGDVVVLTAGVPLGQPGQTNLIKVEEVS